MLVFANADDLYDTCCIILEFHRRFTLTSRTVTCVTTATQNNVLKGSALCKQTAMSHMCAHMCVHVTLWQVSYIVLSLDIWTRDHKMTNGFSCIYTPKWGIIIIKVHVLYILLAWDCLLHQYLPLPPLLNWASLSSWSAQVSLLLSLSILQNTSKSLFVFPRRVSMTLSIWSLLLGSAFTICASSRLIKPPAAFSSMSARPVFIKTLAFSSLFKETKASSFQGLMAQELPSEKQDNAADNDLQETGVHACVQWSPWAGAHRNLNRMDNNTLLQLTGMEVLQLSQQAHWHGAAKLGWPDILYVTAYYRDSPHSLHRWPTSSTYT